MPILVRLSLDPEQAALMGEDRCSFVVVSIGIPDDVKREIVRLIYASAKGEPVKIGFCRGRFLPRETVSVKPSPTPSVVNAKLTYGFKQFLELVGLKIPAIVLGDAQDKAIFVEFEGEILVRLAYVSGGELTHGAEYSYGRFMTLFYENEEKRAFNRLFAIIHRPANALALDGDRSLFRATLKTQFNA